MVPFRQLRGVSAMRKRVYRVAQSLKQIALQRSLARDAAGICSTALAMAKYRNKLLGRSASTFDFAAIRWPMASKTRLR
jgi:hypothetical protein